MRPLSSLTCTYTFNTIVLNMLRQHDLALMPHAHLILTLTVTRTTSQRLAHNTIRASGHTAIDGRAAAPGTHQNAQIRRPTTGCCMGPNRASIALHDANAHGRRCRWPLAALPGKPTFNTSRKCSAHMDTRGTCEIDHGYT